MSDVFRPTYHTPIPAGAKRFVKGGKEYARFRRSGEMVTGEVMPSGKARVISQLYYARIRKNGHTVRIPLGVKDKEAALQLRSQLQLAADQQRAGIIDAFAEHRAKPMTEHLADYIIHLEAKGRSPKHLSETRRTILSVLKSCQFEISEHLSQTDLDTHLSHLIRQGKSYRTRNAAMKAIRALTTWMLKSHRIPADPFQLCETLNEDSDPNRKKRRALSPMDLARLVAAAEVAGVVQSVTGPERALLYTIAATTGLRRGEIAKLLVGDFCLDAEVPYVYPPSHITKARRDDAPIPLHPILVAKLDVWLRDRKPTDLAFHLTAPTGRLRETSKMMKADCKAAGIEYIDDFLGKADFHGHRAAYITALCRANVDLSLVVKLARHSDARLTTRVYDKVQLADKAMAINLLQLTET